MLYLNVELFFPRSMTSRHDVEILLDTLCHQPMLVPERYDFAEPIRRRFDPLDKSKALEFLCGEGPCDDFMWVRRNPKGFGGLYTTVPGRGVHGSVSLSVRASNPAVPGQCMAFAAELATRLSAEFGCVEPLNSTPERPEPGVALSSYMLRNGVPKAYWALFLGSSYTRLVGRNCIEKAPAYECRELASDLFFLQLTADPSDVERSPEDVDAARQALQKHVPIFGQRSQDAPHLAIQVPEFTFPVE